MSIQEILEEQVTVDHQILGQLAEAGDVASLEHAVEHHFVADNPEALVHLCHYAESLGFEPQDIMEGESDEDGEHFYAVDVVGRIPLDDGRVLQHAALMTFIGIAYHVDYDGWGTLVRKAADLPS